MMPSDCDYPFKELGIMKSLSYVTSRVNCSFLRDYEKEKAEPLISSVETHPLALPPCNEHTLLILRQHGY